MIIPAFLIKLVGEKLAKPVFYGALILIALILIFVLAKCTGSDNTATKQAEQTTASSEATADAASVAIATIGDRAVTDAAVDKATATAMEKIEDAQDPIAVRDAVLDSVCGQASHRNDPACAVRRANP